MKSNDQIAIDVHLEDNEFLAAMPEEVRRGLTATPKHLPSKYFYDDVGSRLFEQITDLPEYYPTRAEMALLDEVADEIGRLTRPHELLELGSGAAIKTHRLLDAAMAAGEMERYLPFDVSHDILVESTQRLNEEYPSLEFHAVVGDFDKHLDEIPPAKQRLVAFLGSTIGNFPDATAKRFLERVRGVIGDDGWLLLGTDLVKDVARLEAAYNDSQGITAAFNRNILTVINRHLDGDFDPERFEHVSFFNRDRSRIETYLESTVEQKVRLEAIELDVRFDAKERMRTEVSCKYTRESVEALLEGAGLRLEHWFVDADQTFALSLAHTR